MTTAQLFGQGDGALSRAAGIVAVAKVDLDGLAARLAGQLAEGETRWQGVGGAAFFALLTTWHQKQRQIVSALDDFAAALRATERDNLATDEAQASDYARTQSLLG